MTNAQKMMEWMLEIFGALTRVHTLEILRTERTCGLPHASLSENLRYQGKVSQSRLEAITSRLEASASRWEVFATDWRPSP